jgi:hypothetical protein
MFWELLRCPERSTKAYDSDKGIDKGIETLDIAF